FIDQRTDKKSTLIATVRVLPQDFNFGNKVVEEGNHIVQQDDYCWRK
uniref:Uncharacterized protein n=1 Tax=Anopheles minimus TaxID=112268 RepID=A0A182WNR8_9DIPT